jgi:hypothetical protein
VEAEVSGPYVTAVAKPAAVKPEHWIKSILSYERKERTIVEGLPYG